MKSLLIETYFILNTLEVLTLKDPIGPLKITEFVFTLGLFLIFLSGVFTIVSFLLNSGGGSIFFKRYSLKHLYLREIECGDSVFRVKRVFKCIWR